MTSYKNNCLHRDYYVFTLTDCVIVQILELVNYQLNYDHNLMTCAIIYGSVCMVYWFYYLYITIIANYYIIDTTV